MISRKAARPAPAVTGREPQVIDLLGGKIKPARNIEPKQEHVIAELVGDDCCRCQEIDAAVTANAPVLAMCRQLLATGVDPDRPLRVYRRGALALKVRSIREGARLTVKIAGNGTPIFTLDYPCKGAAAPPARSKLVRRQVSKNSLRAEGATVTVAARAQGSGSRLGAAPRSEFALQR